MSPERWNKIKNLFHSALERKGRARGAFLSQACGDDDDLRSQVEVLITAHESAPMFLEEPMTCSAQQLGRALGSNSLWRAVCEPAADGITDAPDHVPERIGPYRIKGIIASGGMGTVYEATQENPCRLVALKLMKQGIASRTALRRFEYESQILARLRHSGIAQIFEAGTHRDEQGSTPYFAMEYIPDATPITTFARENKLGLRQRIGLFIQACDAVHHAHQKGIIHRDLKPTNILVDSMGQVKVIDFGVARTTDSEFSATTLQTDIGQLIGTLQYMSPEQCEADPHDIDTRSDVYALGVVFYELLIDRLPYDVRGKAIHEATRLIGEEQPIKPSATSRRLRGDVETIALKALEKNRERRYQAAGDLAADLKRFLAGEPIEAKKKSGWYLLRMFARRHRVASIVAAAFVTMLGVTGVVLAYMYSQKVELHKLALEREAEAQQLAKFQSAQLAGIDAHSMGVGLHQDILKSAEEALRTAGADDASVAASITDLDERLASVNFTDLALHALEANIFKRTAQAIEKQFKTQPLVRARLLQTLAETSNGLGLLDLTMTYQTAALDIRKRILGDEHPDTLTSLEGMGYVYRLMGNFDEAMKCYRQALDTRRRVLGDEHPDTLKSIESVGYVLQWTGHLDEALTYRQEALDGCRRVLGDDHEETLNILDAMCSLLISMERYDTALPYCQEAMDSKRRVLGDDDRRTIVSISNMGVVLRRMGRLDAALPYYQDALALGRRILGNDHPGTILSINNMGTFLLSMGRYDEALPYYQEALDRRRRVLGDDHRDTLTSMHNMGYLLRAMGRYEEALGYFREAREGRRRVLGDDDRGTRASTAAMATVLRKLGRFDEADKLSVQAEAPTEMSHE